MIFAYQIWQTFKMDSMNSNKGSCWAYVCVPGSLTLNTHKCRSVTTQKCLSIIYKSRTLLHAFVRLHPVFVIAIELVKQLAQIWIIYTGRICDVCLLCVRAFFLQFFLLLLHNALIFLIYFEYYLAVMAHADCIAIQVKWNYRQN